MSTLQTAGPAPAAGRVRVRFTGAGVDVQPASAGSDAAFVDAFLEQQGTVRTADAWRAVVAGASCAVRADLLVEDDFYELAANSGFWWENHHPAASAVTGATVAAAEPPCADVVPLHEGLSVQAVPAPMAARQPEQQPLPPRAQLTLVPPPRTPDELTDALQRGLKASRVLHQHQAAQLQGLAVRRWDADGLVLAAPTPALYRAACAYRRDIERFLAQMGQHCAVEILQPDDTRAGATQTEAGVPPLRVQAGGAVWPPASRCLSSPSRRGARRPSPLPSLAPAARAPRPWARQTAYRPPPRTG